MRGSKTFATFGPYNNQNTTTMSTITATGHNNGTFIYNTFDGSWDFADDVDTSHPRYEATADDMASAIDSADGTLLDDIQINA